MTSIREAVRKTTPVLMEGGTVAWHGLFGAAELDRLGAEAAICDRDVVLAAPPAGDGRAYTAFIDNALARGATIVAARTDELAEAADAHHGTAVIAPLGIDVGAPEQLRLFAIA